MLSCRVLSRFFYVLTAVLLLPPALNLFGWNAYLEHDGEKRLWTLGCANGVLHASTMPPREGWTMFNPLEFSDLKTKELLTVGKFSLFLESRLDEMRPLGFHFHHASKDSALEFPWLLLVVLSLGAAIASRKRIAKY